jgi:hypothetical protein
MAELKAHPSSVSFWPKRTWQIAPRMSALESSADIIGRGFMGTHRGMRGAGVPADKPPR